MLGPSYGSTDPAQVNPKTGKPYGADFPAVTLADIVNVQKALRDSLGAKHLLAAAGPSFGGYQAFQWGVTYPTFMDGLVVVVSPPKGSGGEASIKALIDVLAKDPNSNGGKLLRERRPHQGADRHAGGHAQALRHRRAARRPVPRQGRARGRDRQAGRDLVEGVRRQFSGRPARCQRELRRRKGLRQDRGQGAVRPVVPTISRSTATSATPPRASMPPSGPRG